MELAIHAAFLVAGVLMSCAAWDIEKACGYTGCIALVMGIGITMLYSGSYHGLFVAAIASVLVDASLRAIKWWRGCKRLTRHGRRYYWVYYPR